MLRYLFLALTAAVHLGLSAAGACAGDGAALNVLGFSDDGRYFAFEQYGTQDGSAFPFAEIAFVDTQAATSHDRPYMVFRDVIQSEAAELDAVRANVLARARPHLAVMKIQRQGMVVAIDPVARPFEALLPMDVPVVRRLEASELRLADPTRGGALVLGLKQWKMSSPSCSTMAPGETRAFALTVAKDGSPARDIHVDAELPDSRRCPYTYGLVGAYLQARKSGGAVIAVVVSYYPVGFEGLDRRFLVVTADLK
ncbi:MAG TPA: DUF2259 domain-containing protein [Vineibacter sp.]|nr:DUF2259 domain-containing protein [Vineibacter sp.]